MGGRERYERAIHRRARLCMFCSSAGLHENVSSFREDRTVSGESRLHPCQHGGLSLGCLTELSPGALSERIAPTRSDKLPSEKERAGSGGSCLDGRHPKCRHSLRSCDYSCTRAEGRWGQFSLALPSPLHLVVRLRASSFLQYHRPRRLWREPTRRGARTPRPRAVFSLLRANYGVQVFCLC